MELFNRIKEISKYFTGSDKALAEKLGFKQATFSGYLNEKRQDNLWPLLPKILLLFPSLSRDWLYFGEGPMLKPEQEINQSESPVPSLELSTGERVTHLESEVTELTLELRGALKEIRRLNEEKRELEDRLRSEQSFAKHHRDNPRSATKGKTAHIAS
ncbi:MAG: hypothetical protein V8Q84_04900 [Bilophila sp.]